VQTGSFSQLFLADSSILPCFAKGFGKSPPVNHHQLYQESLISLNRLKYSTKFPIPLPDSATLKRWECLDLATGEASASIGFRRDKLAEADRKNNLPDFSNWPPPAAFARAFTSVGTHEKQENRP